MADAELTQLRTAIQRQWSRVASQKAKPYVKAFFAAVRTGTKITAKVVGNHGTYTVSIQLNNQSLTSPTVASHSSKILRSTALLLPRSLPHAYSPAGEESPCCVVSYPPRQPP